MPPTMTTKTAAIKQGIRNAIANDNLKDLLKGRDPSHSKAYHVAFTQLPKDIVNRIPEVKECYYLTTTEKNQCADTPERKAAARTKKSKFSSSMLTIKRQEKREVAEPISPDEPSPQRCGPPAILHQPVTPLPRGQVNVYQTPAPVPSDLVTQTELQSQIKIIVDHVADQSRQAALYETEQRRQAALYETTQRKEDRKQAALHGKEQRTISKMFREDMSELKRNIFDTTNAQATVINKHSTQIDELEVGLEDAKGRGEETNGQVEVLKVAVDHVVKDVGILQGQRDLIFSQISFIGAHLLRPILLLCALCWIVSRPGAWELGVECLGVVTTCVTKMWTGAMANLCWLSNVITAAGSKAWADLPDLDTVVAAGADACAWTAFTGFVYASREQHVQSRTLAEPFSVAGFEEMMCGALGTCTYVSMCHAQFEKEVVCTAMKVCDVWEQPTCLAPQYNAQQFDVGACCAWEQ